MPLDRDRRASVTRQKRYPISALTAPLPCARVRLGLISRTWMNGLGSIVDRSQEPQSGLPGSRRLEKGAGLKAEKASLGRRCFAVAVSERSACGCRNHLSRVRNTFTRSGKHLCLLSGSLCEDASGAETGVRFVGGMNGSTAIHGAGPGAL